MSAKRDRFINRELSWLEFNQRVLDEACNETIPLLERLKFLAITASNLDEFFMVRVGGLQMLAAERGRRVDPAGMTPNQQLKAIGERTQEMTADQYACLADLEDALQQHGIVRVTGDTLTTAQRNILEQAFASEIFPILTPIAVEEAETLPLLVNQQLHLGVALEPIAENQPPRIAIIPLGGAARRVLTLPAEAGYAYILLEDVVTEFQQQFFPGENIIGSATFRITRNADMQLREDLAPDLMEGMEEVLDARITGGCVRLEISADAPDAVADYLTQILQVQKAELFRAPGPIDLSAYFAISGLAGYEDLQLEAWPPQASPDVDLSAGMFQVLAEKDVMLIHPYQSFEPVVRLIEEAAEDPDVLAIKQVLYRTSRNSPVVAALCRAAENGKSVTVVMELKARFDEARNIGWARELEQAGVQVIYGVKRLKTHAKILLVVRREPHGIVRYTHFGTGNYNEATARIYSDVSFLTSDDQYGADATNFFNAVTGYSQPQSFLKISMAPTNLRTRLLEMIEVETQNKKKGDKAKIVAKINSLADPEMIEALYAASAAGVSVQLNVRGICCLRPGVKGLSENIRVISIVDRFLEHARIIYFHHGGDETVFISSADWMPRNLDKRVELLTPIDTPDLKSKLISTLEVYFRDNTKARRLLPDGTHAPVTKKKSAKQVQAQEKIYRSVCESVEAAERSRRTVFEPHQAQ